MAKDEDKKKRKKRKSVAESGLMSWKCQITQRIGIDTVTEAIASLDNTELVEVNVTTTMVNETGESAVRLSLNLIMARIQLNWYWSVYSLQSRRKKNSSPGIFARWLWSYKMISTRYDPLVISRIRQYPSWLQPWSKEKQYFQRKKRQE